MRLMSPSLVAAGQGVDAAPFVRVRISDAVAGVRRLRFTTLYAGSEPDAPHGAAVCADGSLIRAYRASATSVLYQRIAAPAAGSAWSSWSNVSPTSGQDVAVGAAGSRAIIAWDDAGTVQVLTSGDSGASWSGPATAATGTIAQVACAQKADGTRIVVWWDPTLGRIQAARESGGVWTAGATATPFATVTGLAATHDAFDWVIAVTGTALGTGNPSVWTIRYGDGGEVASGTWEAPRLLLDSDDPVNIVYQAPAIWRADILRVLFVERWTGAGAYTLNFHTWLIGGITVAANRWRDPVPLATSLLHGPALAAASAVYLSAPGLVQQSAIPSITGVDWSDRVIEAEWSEPGRARLLFDNSDGAMTDTIVLGSEVEVLGGYRTSAGNELPGSGPAPTYWIDRVRHLARNDGRALVEIEAGDVWSLLDGWTARRQLTWTAAASLIVAGIAAWAGVAFSQRSASTDFTTLTTSFTVPAGTTAGAAIRRLYRLFPDQPAPDGPALANQLVAAADPVVYSYGAAHPIQALVREDRATVPAFVRVLASGAVGQAKDDAALALLAGTAVFADRAITTAVQAATAASALLHEAQIAARRDAITVLPNVGQIPLDVVTVNGASRRVIAITTRLVRGKYEQRIELGGV